MHKRFGTTTVLVMNAQYQLVYIILACSSLLFIHTSRHVYSNSQKFLYKPQNHNSESVVNADPVHMVKQIGLENRPITTRKTLEISNSFYSVFLFFVCYQIALRTLEKFRKHEPQASVYYQSSFALYTTYLNYH